MNISAHHRRRTRDALWGAALALGLAPAATMADPAVKTWSLGATSASFLGQRELAGWNDDAIARFTYSKATATYGLTAAIGFKPDDVVLDGSRFEGYFDGWTLGVGAVERHWSPSPHSSLILSRNARPLPSVYLRRDRPIRFETPLLSWLGPIDGEVFVADSDGKAGPGDGRLFGARLGLRPLEGLEIDLVRTAQWTGGAKGFWDMLIGNTNEGRSSAVNQMAGVGVSYTLPANILPARAYFQVIGEDEAGGLPSCFMHMAGVELESDLKGVPTLITLEGVDTRIETSTNGFCGPDTAYNHRVYPYTRDGTVMGAAIDSESLSWDLYVTHELPDLNVSWSLGYVTLNDASNPDHRLSTVRVSGPRARLGVETDWQGLKVDAQLVYQGFDLDRAEFDEGARVLLNVSRQF